MNSALLDIELSQYPLIRKGKVRSLYDIGDEKILIVASDRISAFDVVLPNGIPGKGIILTQLSNFWFQHFSEKIPHHLLSANIRSLKLPNQLEHLLGERSVIVKKTKVLPFECIVRGYISGSLWRSYISGNLGPYYSLPQDLEESQRLKEPIFTPTTKAQSGHDTPVSEKQMINSIGKELTLFLKETSLNIYNQAHEYALNRGIILADSKFEFGLFHDEPIMIDELLTPDSSRFWEKDTFHPGQSQTSFDKQFIRDYLDSLAWNKQYPGPQLPESILEMTQKKYLDAYTKLTGKTLTLS